MRISARNQLPGTVVSIEKGAVNGVVKIEVAPGVIITSSITNAAIEELELAEGKKAVAVVKASSVMVGLQAPTRGEVLFKGRRLGRSAAERRELGRSVSVVFQDPATALNPRMIVHDALIDPLNVHGIGSAAQREALCRTMA